MRTAARRPAAEQVQERLVAAPSSFPESSSPNARAKRPPAETAEPRMASETRLADAGGSVGQPRSEAFCVLGGRFEILILDRAIDHGEFGFDHLGGTGVLGLGVTQEGLKLTDGVFQALDNRGGGREAARASLLLCLEVDELSHGSIVDAASDTFGRRKENAVPAAYNPGMANEEATALLLAALTCGERMALQRARNDVALAPDDRARGTQQMWAEQEERNLELVTARLEEVGDLGMVERFQVYFEAFHRSCSPADWAQAQALHYVGDALVSEFAESLTDKLDPVSAEVVQTVLGNREAEETFALDELQRAMETDPAVRDQIARYARRISGEALTQTSRALDSAAALREMLGGIAGEKALLLELLERHRVRLDRLGIDLLELADDDDEL